jgi:hypothetical protein
MDLGNSITVRLQSFILTLAIIVAFLLTTAYGQNAGVELFLQQSPAQGGKITPGTGIHSFAPNSEITLTAIPEPGFQFAYWLGDVTDPRADSTTVYLNDPKIIVAVFEPIEIGYATEKTHPRISGRRSGGFTGGGGGFGTQGGMIAAAADYSRGGFSGGSASGPKPQAKKLSFEPIAIPEPATILILTLSVAILRKHRGSNG